MTGVESNASEFRRHANLFFEVTDWKSEGPYLLKNISEFQDGIQHDSTRKQPSNVVISISTVGL